MARTELTVNRIDRDGLADPASATGTVDGHFVNNNGRTFLEVANANAAARILTIPTPPTYRGQPVDDLAISVPGSAQRFKAGPFDPDLVNKEAGTQDAGAFYVNYPAGQHADITVRVFTI